MKVVGPDEAGHRAEVETLVRKAGLAADFEFTGLLQGEALRKIYEEADLFLLPSYTENFGMVVAEALSHGLPVITTHGAPWQVLEREHCGWWVPVSVEGIVTALEDVLSRNPEELAAMGERGKALVEREFSWPQVARRMKDLYAEVAGQGLPCAWVRPCILTEWVKDG